MRDSRGFSLIELLIVVAIILIVAAIALPSLLRARIAANESAMVADSRAILAAEQAYAAAAGAAADLTCLVQPGACCTGLGTTPMLDSLIGAANAGVVKSGYRRQFNGDGSVPSAEGIRLVAHHVRFSYEGVPVTIGVSGIKAFCVDSSGKFCFDPTGAAMCAGATEIVNCPVGQSLGE